MQEPVFPVVSRAVTVTVVVPTGKLAPDAGLALTAEPGQLSVDEIEKIAMLLHAPGAVFNEIGEGQAGTGGSTSFTVNEKLHEFEFPAASTLVPVTEVVPTGKVEPEAGENESVDPQLSVLILEKLTTALQEPLVFAETGGQFIDGGSVSVTVIVKLQLPTRPELSVALPLTEVAPTGKTEPDTGDVPEEEIPQLSEGERAKVATALQAPGSVGRPKDAGHPGEGG